MWYWVFIVKSGILKFSLCVLERIISLNVFTWILLYKLFLIILGCSFFNLISFNFKLKIIRVFKKIIGCFSSLLNKFSNFHHVFNTSLFFSGWYLTHNIHFILSFLELRLLTILVLLKILSELMWVLNGAIHLMIILTIDYLLAIILA